MACLEIIGGKRLYGELVIQGSKNAVLPMLSACLLCKEKVVIGNCPDIYDVACMTSLLKKLGAKMEEEGHTKSIMCENIACMALDKELAGKMRASVLLTAPLLARCGRVKFPYPGGCVIGRRPIDLHIEALEQMNVNFVEEDGFIYGTTDGLQGADIFLPFPSVGATEQIILAGVLATGITKITNAAKEPEIVSLCQLLNLMGAKISGVGSSIIVINGVNELGGTSYRVPSDRIVAETYLAAVAACGGEVKFALDCADQMGNVVELLKKMGMSIEEESGYLQCKAKEPVKNIEGIYTEVYPGFPTDMQSVFLALMATGSGQGSMEEKIFESRFACVRELQKMGANIQVDHQKRTAYVTGTKGLLGTSVEAKDLRGGAALVVAALNAKGKTIIQGIEFLDRGYENLALNLSQLGANIVRIGG